MQSQLYIITQYLISWSTYNKNTLHSFFKSLQSSSSFIQKSKIKLYTFSVSLSHNKARSRSSFSLHEDRHLYTTSTATSKSGFNGHHQDVRRRCFLLSSVDFILSSVDLVSPDVKSQNLNSFICARPWMPEIEIETDESESEWDWDWESEGEREKVEMSEI